MHKLHALGGMLNIPQWFIWRLTWNVSDGKYDKVPCYPNGGVYRMDAKNPANHMPLSVALQHLNSLHSTECRYALGFYLTADTGYWFADLDKCVLADGSLAPHAQQICAAFPGAAWEYSSSRKGLHIFGRGTVPEHRCRDIQQQFNLEFYTEGRGIAFGLDAEVFGNADLDHSGAVAWLVNAYFPPDRNPDGSVIKPGQFDQPAPEWNGIKDDEVLIMKMRSSEKADAGAVFAGVPSSRVTFSDLYDCDAAAIERRWPGDGGSSADASLIAMLAFWTGRDAPRTERIMRQSKLYRPKWDEARGSDNFLRYSIDRIFTKHVCGNGTVYGKRDVAAVVANDAPITVIGQDVSIDHAATIDVFLLEIGNAGNMQELFAVCDRIKATNIPRKLVERLVYEAKEKFTVFKTPQSSDSLRRAMWYVPVRPIGESKGRQLTEFGNMLRFVDRYGKGLMYVPVLDRWHRWNDYYWQPAINEEILNLAQETIFSLTAEMMEMENESERGAMNEWIKQSEKMSMVSNMVRGATSRPEIVAPYTTLDANPDLLGVSNGSVDLRTGVLMPPDPGTRITTLAGVAYDPFAKCPLFVQTVSDVFFNDAAMVSFFKRLMGYTLMGRPKESILVIPYGSGANGKSTVLGAIQKALGGYARSVAGDTFVSQEGKPGGNAGGPREDLLRLRGARYAYINEIEENSQLRESLIKTLTGDDVIVARGINAKNSMEFRPTFVPVMPTNHKPIIKGDDTGIWRRVMLIPFTRNFTIDKSVQRDLKRAERLDAELPGILRWLVEGAIEYQAFGLGIPPGVLEAGEDYRKDMDILSEWLEEKCELGPEYAELSASLYMNWRSFADQRGQLRLVASAQVLSRKLEAKGCKAGQHRNGLRGRCVVGIRLKNVFAGSA